MDEGYQQPRKRTLIGWDVSAKLLAADLYLAVLGCW